MKEYRKHASTPQKMKIRAKDRDRKRIERSKEKTKLTTKTSYKKILEASKAIRDILGDSPQKYKEVMNHVFLHVLRSPRKKEKLSDILCFSTPPNQGPIHHDVMKSPPSEEQKDFNKLIQKLCVYRAKGKKQEARKIVNILMKKSKQNVTRICSVSGQDYNRVYRLLSTPKKRRKKEYTRKLTDGMKQEAIDIYYSSEVSYGLPEAKYSEMYFMSCTIKEAYNVYLSKCTTERKIALSTFFSLKPDNIRTINETPLRGCKCEYCQNLAMLRSTLIALGFKGIPRNHACSIEITWCEFRKQHVPPLQHRDEDCSKACQDINKNELPHKDCVMRKCKSCGIDKYKRVLEEMNTDLLMKRGTVYWKQWKLLALERKSNKGKSIKRMGLQQFSGTYSKILEKYLSLLDTMSIHQFNKIWQMKNFNEALRNLQIGQVLFVHDFSQNLLMYLQDEVSAAHWDHEQITIHPTVAFYVCEKCSKVVKEELIHITSDKKHDVQAVRVFQQKSIQHLLSKGVRIEEIIEFTDHCASQYKGKTAFFLLSEMKYPLCRHYFGVKHGKGPSDRAGAHFKNFIRKVVKSGKSEMSNCSQLAKFCQDEYDFQKECDENGNETNDEEENTKKNPAHALLKVIYTTDNLEKCRKKFNTKDLKTIKNTGRFIVFVTQERKVFWKQETPTAAV